jgi:hypothetical protein
MNLLLGLLRIAPFLRQHGADQLGLAGRNSGNVRTGPQPFENGFGEWECIEEGQAVCQERVAHIAAEGFLVGIDPPPPILPFRHKMPDPLLNGEEGRSRIRRQRAAGPVAIESFRCHQQIDRELAGCQTAGLKVERINEVIESPMEVIALPAKSDRAEVALIGCFGHLADDGLNGRCSHDAPHASFTSSRRLRATRLRHSARAAMPSQASYCDRAALIRLWPAWSQDSFRQRVR